MCMLPDTCDSRAESALNSTPGTGSISKSNCRASASIAVFSQAPTFHGLVAVAPRPADLLVVGHGKREGARLGIGFGRAYVLRATQRCRNSSPEEAEPSNPRASNSWWNYREPLTRGIAQRGLPRRRWPTQRSIASRCHGPAYRSRDVIGTYSGGFE